MKLSSKGSSGTCILEVFYDIPPYCFHGAAAHLRRILLMEQQVWSVRQTINLATSCRSDKLSEQGLRKPV